MKKTLITLIGVALFVLGVQDIIRIILGNQGASIFAWMPGGTGVHVILDIILIIDGIILTRYASRVASRNN